MTTDNPVTETELADILTNPYSTHDQITWATAALVYTHPADVSGYLHSRHTNYLITTTTSVGSLIGWTGRAARGIEIRPRGISLHDKPTHVVTWKRIAAQVDRIPHEAADLYTAAEDLMTHRRDGTYPPGTHNGASINDLCRHALTRIWAHLRVVPPPTLF